jgi:probable phosphoglycerate mutase
MSDLRELLVARHGQSAANAAAADAWPDGDTLVEGRDRDVPLTALGRRQAFALGSWLSDRPPPDAVVCSPFQRARETWRIAATGLAVPAATYDERLIDRDMGELELLTPRATDERHPDEMGRRLVDGEWLYRPPGGETLLDVASRLESLLIDLRRAYAGKSVLLVAHDAVVVMTRFLVDGLTLDELADVARADVANASVTRFDGTEGRLRFESYRTTV